MVKVSIIIPIYNGERYIQPIVDMVERNVKNMCDTFAEIVFVNDYPETYLNEVRSSLKNVSTVFVENLENIGIHGTKINGFNHSTGDYIVFLDQDDIIQDNYITSQLSELNNSDGVFCNGIYKGNERIFSKTPVKSNFNNYLTYGYPLVSLGQLMLKRESISKSWTNNILKNNGWDDAFLWACLMLDNKKIEYNDDLLYCHVEDGSNLSFNWKKMRLSGEEYANIFPTVANMNDTDNRKFKEMIGAKLYKYGKYLEIDDEWNNVCDDCIINYFKNNNYKRIALYGVGVYGKKLINILSKSDVEIIYGIDKRSSEKSFAFKVYDEELESENIDVIICSTVFDDENVRKKLKNKSVPIMEVLKESRAMTLPN